MTEHSWAETLKEAEKEFDPGSNDAGLLLEYVSGKTRMQLRLLSEEPIPKDVLERFRTILEQRRTHQPVQYLTGRQNFMGLELRVTPEVLIPRPETELLAEKVIQRCNGKTVLDLCTGSGCIAIAVQKLGKAASVAASDISEAALAVAKENAKELEADINWYCGNLFEAVGTMQYDIIVSNPPYIRSSEIPELMPEVRDYEPHLALDGSADGLEFYRRIAAGAAAHLVLGGELLLEIGCDQREEVCSLLEQAGFEQVVCHKDYSGLDRMVTGRLRS